MNKSNLHRARWRKPWRAAHSALLALSALLVVLSGCGSGGSRTIGSSGSASSVLSSSATRGKGTVTFTIKWPPSTTTTTRLVPVASKSIQFTVTESEAPNNVVVLTKVAARPTDGSATSTVALEGLPTVLVSIKATAYPNADATGVVQASGTLSVSVEQNKTIDKTVTLDSTVKTVEVTAAAPATITDGKLALNLNAQTDLKAVVTATAYNAAHEVVLTALDKWVYKSDKPSVATVSDPTQSRAQKNAQKSRAFQTREEGISGSTVTITAQGAGSSTVTVTESESQINTRLAVDVAGSPSTLWNQDFGDAQNSSCSSGPGASPNKVGAFTPPTSLGSHRFVESAGGKVALADDHTYEYTRDGKLVQKTSGYYSGAFGLASGSDGTLYTLDAPVPGDFSGNVSLNAFGARNWTTSIQIANYENGATTFTLSGDEKTIYINIAGKLTAFSASSGSQLWETQVRTDNGDCKPAVSLDNQTVYAPTDAGIAAFDAATGGKRWETTTVPDGSYVGVGPNGTVYADGIDKSDVSLTGYGGIVALNPQNGQIIWETTMSEERRFFVAMGRFTLRRVMEPSVLLMERPVRRCGKPLRFT